MTNFENGYKWVHSHEIKRFNDSFFLRANKVKVVKQEIQESISGKEYLMLLVKPVIISLRDND